MTSQYTYKCYIKLHSSILRTMTSLNVRKILGGLTDASLCECIECKRYVSREYFERKFISSFGDMQLGFMGYRMCLNLYETSHNPNSHYLPNF